MFFVPNPAMQSRPSKLRTSCPLHLISLHPPLRQPRPRPLAFPTSSHISPIPSPTPTGQTHLATHFLPLLARSQTFSAESFVSTQIIYLGHSSQAFALPLPLLLLLLDFMESDEDRRWGECECRWQYEMCDLMQGHAVYSVVVRMHILYALVVLSL